MLLKLLKDAFPIGTFIPKSFYESKRKLCDLGLGYDSIHACKYLVRSRWSVVETGENHSGFLENKWEYELKTYQCGSLSDLKMNLPTFTLTPVPTR